MPDLPKQELDELFREGADMQQFEYNEAAWQNMEVMLDADDKNRRIGTWLFLFVGVAIAIIGGLWYTSLEDENSSKEDIYATADELFNSSDIQKYAQSKELLQKDLSGNEEIAIVATNSLIDNSLKDVSDVKIADIDNEKRTPTEWVSQIKNHKDESLVSNDNENSILVAPSLVSNERVAFSSPAKTVIVSVDESQTVEKAWMDVERLRNSDLKPIKIPFTTPYNRLSKVDVDLLKDKEKSMLSLIANKLSVTLFAAPEWSSVGIDNNKKRGYKFGAKLGFQLSDKFEISTGLSLSQKKFDGKGSEFTITEGWIDDIMPTTMDAKCNVIEIPLDFTYHFNGVGNTGLLASVGVRSFLLHSEWYGFEYNKSQYRPDLLEEKVMDNQNKNWVGSIELSLGYNRKVSDHLSVQIAPYLQIPMTGIGEGKVNLYSGGLQFAVRFDGK